jgi:Tol biopolymer transport system component
VLVFATNSFGQNYDIYIYDTKTGSTSRVTTMLPGVDEYNPSFSNNDKYIVHDVLNYPPPPAALFQDLFIANISTGFSTPLTGGEGGNDASWSPNGKYIAFDRAPSPNPGVSLTDENIYIVPASGGTRVLVVENAVDPDWSYNSKYLVFTSIVDGSVRTRAVIGDPLDPGTIVADGGVNPVWSPNGKYIAYSDGNNIFKVLVNGAGAPLGAEVKLTSDGPGVYNTQPSWSKNSKTIVFHSNRVSGDFDLWTVPASGGSPNLLTGLGGAGDYDPAYSNNGKLVAYAAVDEPPTISSKDLEVSDDEADANTVVLEQNSPNPFNPTTEIRFQLPEVSQVQLTVYNALGQAVRSLAKGSFEAGQYRVIWDARDNYGIKVPSGIYIYRLQTGNLVEQRKMILLK